MEMNERIVRDFADSFKRHIDALNLAIDSFETRGALEKDLLRKWVQTIPISVSYFCLEEIVKPDVIRIFLVKMEDGK